MSPRRITTLAELRALVGEEVGISDWLEITQERIDAFAEATRDRQWIHVDPERASAGLFGTTVAHGYLTLSLLPSFGLEILQLELGDARVNYGLDDVRFPAPVRVGSRVRGRAAVHSVQETRRGVQLRIRYTVEIEGQDRPACVATQITLIVT